MKFQLKEAKRGRSNVSYHVVDEQQSIIGSINVKLEDADSLLRHWQGAKADSPQQKQSPIQALASVFLQHRIPVNKAALLRGCMG